MYVCTIDLTPARGNVSARSRLHLLDRINEQLAELRKAAPRARARVIPDGQEVVDAFCDAWAARKADDDVAVSAVDYCEFVPSSYQYRADSDRIDIDGTLDGEAMKVNITVTRGTASRRARGRGDTVVARLKKAGQRQSRIRR